MLKFIHSNTCHRNISEKRVVMFVKSLYCRFRYPGSVIGPIEAKKENVGSDIGEKWNWFWKRKCLCIKTCLHVS